MGCKIPILNNILNVSDKPDLGLLKILCDVKDLVVPTNRLGPVVWIFFRIPETERDWDSKGFIKPLPKNPKPPTTTQTTNLPSQMLNGTGI